MAQLSPPTDAQASQLAALFAMLRHESPLVVTSAEALMTRTIPRTVFNESIVKVAIGDRLDLDALVEALAACGYQRVPQTEEAGDFSVRGGIVDAFSPLYRDPIRIELEDDLITSIRHFDADEPALGRRARRGDDHAHPLRAAVCAEGPEAARAGRVAGCGNRDGAQGGRGTVRGARERAAVSGRGTADAVCVRARARQRVRLHAGGHAAVAGRSGARPRRGKSLCRHRQQRDRGGGAQARVSSRAGLAVPRRGRVRARARKFHRGRGRLAGDDGSAARGMGGAGRGQVAGESAARIEPTERRADAAELRAAGDRTARSPARAGSLADDRRGSASGRRACAVIWRRGTSRSTSNARAWRRCWNGRTIVPRSWRARFRPASFCRPTDSTSTARRKFSASRERAGAGARPRRARCSISRS